MAAVIASAALLAGCGTSSTANTSTTGTTATTSASGGFNPELVPANGSSPGKKFPAEKPKKSQSKSSGGSGGGSSSGSSSGSGSFSSATPHTRTIVKTQTKTETHTVTVSHTITRTVTKTVRPKVPAGASLPSTRAALSLSRFSASGGNIGCRFSGGSVRCDIGRRVWSPPSKPHSCHVAWGQGLTVGSSGSAKFVCAGNSVLDPTGHSIKAGYDDKVGSVTCQVRSFGVTCFEPDGSGFFIGRTGYTTF